MQVRAPPLLADPVCGRQGDKGAAGRAGGGDAPAAGTISLCPSPWSSTAPLTYLPQNRHPAQGLVPGARHTPPAPHQLTFKLFFPRAPFQGVEYPALKLKGDAWNFVVSYEGRGRDAPG